MTAQSILEAHQRLRAALLEQPADPTDQPPDPAEPEAARRPSDAA
ncbi:MAG: hypothetical protein ACXVGK_06145 [Mycobacteriaceae bacterium]